MKKYDFAVEMNNHLANLDKLNDKLVIKNASLENKSASELIKSVTDLASRCSDEKLKNNILLIAASIAEESDKDRGAISTK